MKKRKTLHIVTIKELDEAATKIEDCWATFDVFGIGLITIIIAIIVGKYCDEFAYVGLVIVIGFLCMVIACSSLDGGKKRRKIAHIKSRLLARENRKRAMMEKNKKKKKTKQKESWSDEWVKFLKLDENRKTKWKKTSKKEEPVYLKHDYPPVKNPDMYDIDMDDDEYFRDLDLDDEEYLDIDLDDYYEYLDNRDKKTYEPRYKPSATEWLGGYLIASKAFDKLFKSNNKNKEY